MVKVAETMTEAISAFCRSSATLKTSKKVTAVNPKCPTGYKKK